MTAIAPALRQTRRSIGAAVRRPDSAGVIVLTTGLYIAAYLWAIGYLFPRSGTLSIQTVSQPFERMFQQSGTFLWEPVARIDAGVVSFLFSPFNTGLALVLGVLVGLNIGVAYLAWRQPAACGIGAGSGALAAVPALISGSACCAPVLLIVLGIQASGLLLLAFEVALPLGVVLLIGTLVYVGRMGAVSQVST